MSITDFVRGTVIVDHRGPGLPASDSLVRTIIRSALDHSGARVPFTMKETEPGAWAVEARRDGQWVVNSGVDGSTLAGLQQTAEAFAREVALAMEALGQCPMCQSFPMLCEFHGAANTRQLAAVDECDALVGEARVGQAEPLVNGRTLLPPGWAWDDGLQCSASFGADRWVLLETRGINAGVLVDHHGAAPVGSPIRDAIMAEARRIGLPIRPTGYQWRIKRGSVCVAREGHGVWAWIYPDGPPSGTWVTLPEHAAALAFALAVLGQYDVRDRKKGMAYGRGSTPMAHLLARGSHCPSTLPRWPSPLPCLANMT